MISGGRLSDVFGFAPAFTANREKEKTSRKRHNIGGELSLRLPA